MKKYLYSPSQVSLNSPTETDFDGNKSDATATKVKLNEKSGSDDKVRTFEYESHITCSTINLLTLFKWLYIHLWPYFYTFKLLDSTDCFMYEHVNKMDKSNLLFIFYIKFSVLSLCHFQIAKNLYEINKVCFYVIKSLIFFLEFQRPSTAATTFGSRIIHKDRKMDLDSDSENENAESEALADLNDLKAIRKEEDFKPVEGMPGMYYKVRLRINCVQFTGIIKINNLLFPLLRNQHVPLSLSLSILECGSLIINCV